MAYKIAVLSRKGGSGKTTITSGLAHGLALMGHKVLALEIDDRTRLRNLLTGDKSRLDDTQTAYSLFTQPELGIGRSAYTVDEASLLSRVPSLDKQRVAELVKRRGWQHPRSFDFVPGSKRLRDVENKAQLAQSSHVDPYFEPFTQLTKALRAVDRHYEVILMDTPPSLQTIQTNILMTADTVIFVLDFHADSIDDYNDTEEFYRNSRTIARRLDCKPPSVLGVVYNMFHPDVEEIDQQILHAYTEAHYEEDGNTLVGPLVSYQNLGVIPYDWRRVVGADIARMSLHTYAPTSTVGEAMWLMVSGVHALIMQNRSAA